VFAGQAGSLTADANYVVEFPLSGNFATRGADVEPINTYAFYEIGGELQPLKAEYPGNALAQHVVLPLHFASWRLERLLKGDPIEITLSRQAASNLRGMVDAILKMINPATGSDGQQLPPQWAEIPSWQWGMVRSNVQIFENVFQAEMQNATTYSVPRRGLYSTPVLVNQAESAFPALWHSAIQEKARNDFHEAGRCLAFNLSTAAGFHACRAVEGVLEGYYQFFTGKTGTLHGWQDYLDALRKVTTGPIPDPKTLHNIKQIKDFSRNPLMHPRETLNEMDARILFGMAEIAILGMAQELMEAEHASQPAFPTLDLPQIGVA
jgi:hypothetical protein